MGRSRAMRRAVEGLLWAASATLVVLAFVWPLAVSRDPADPAFRVAGIAALVVFFAALAVAVALRLCAAQRGAT